MARASVLEQSSGDYGKVFENIEADDNSQKLSDENILSPDQKELARKNTLKMLLQIQH